MTPEPVVVDTRRMRSMTFVVHFDGDIGTPCQNQEIGEAIARDLEALLFGYLDGHITDGEMLHPGSAFGIEVQDPAGQRDVRVREVHYVEPSAKDDAVSEDDG